MDIATTFVHGWSAGIEMEGKYWSEYGRQWDPGRLSSKSSELGAMKKKAIAAATVIDYDTSLVIRVQNAV